MKNMPPKTRVLDVPIVDSYWQPALPSSDIDRPNRNLVDYIGKSAFIAAQSLFGEKYTIPGSFFAISEDGIPYKVESNGAGSLREINLTENNGLGGLGGTVISEKEINNIKKIR